MKLNFMIGPDRDAMVATAQARRERGRMAVMQAEISDLRRRVAELEHSPSRRALEPVRRVIHAVIPAVSAVRQLLRPSVQHPPLPDVAAVSTRGLAVVIDHDWPQPNRDSGSIDIFNLVMALRQLGFETILAAARQHDGEQPARDWLIAQGVRCLQAADANSVEDFIRQQGAAIDLCVLCRVYCGGEFLELAQQHCRSARIVYNSIDLNYLREKRKAEILGDAGLLAIAEQVREREEHVIRSCDATFVVSQAELDLLATTMPDCLVGLTPLARMVHAPATPFALRQGIGFIGGFAHAPNVDAVSFFLAEIWPLVRRALPTCEMTIVGAGLPPSLLEGHAGVRSLGHLPDVGPWFESLRLTVAPLRFGAGAKGKVASSLAAGVPCIATSVASEGMSLTEEDGILVADTPAAFAAAIVRAYEDAEVWGRLSAGGLAYARTTLSLHSWQARLDAMLQRLGL